MGIGGMIRRLYVTVPTWRVWEEQWARLMAALVVGFAVLKAMRVMADEAPTMRIVVALSVAALVAWLVGKGK